MKPQRLPYKEFLEIYSKVPRLCVDLAIKTKDGVVLSKRLIPPYKGYWHTPGGTVLYGEKLEEAVKRVAEDETGLKVKIVKYLGPIEFPMVKELKHAVSLGFLVEPLAGDLRGSNQGKDIAFFKKLPPKTVKPQAEFLKKYKLA